MNTQELTEGHAWMTARWYAIRHEMTQLPLALRDPESPRLRRVHAYLRGELTPPEDFSSTDGRARETRNPGRDS